MIVWCFRHKRPAHWSALHGRLVCSATSHVVRAPIEKAA